MNKKGFIATSLIYSFFLIFITLFLTIIADYLQNKVLLNTIENGIKNDINYSLGIQDFKIGDKLFFTASINDINANSLCEVIGIDYINSGASNDKLTLNCSGVTKNIDITNKRLKKISSEDGFIDIEGVTQ